MATANHVLLRRITLTASASSVTFDSIPQTGYTDLKIVVSARDASTGAYANDLNININGASTNVSTKVLYGTGAAVASTTSGVWAANVPANNATASTYGNAEFYFPNYNSTSTPKSFNVDSVTENNATNSLAMLTAGLFNTNTAISSITFLLYGGTSFAAGSSFSLYGIADVNTTPALAPKADGGDIIKTDGTYWYHAFLSSAIFRPQLNLTCDVLAIAGGGAGGLGSADRSGGGGGGAGGLLYSTGVALSGNLTVTVGAGGASVIGSGGYGRNGGQGSNSTVGSVVTAIGGGYGAGDPGTGGAPGGTVVQGGTGGSGGGASYIGGSSGITNVAASGYTSGQGNAGGGIQISGSYTGSRGGAGGGGAGAAALSITFPDTGTAGGAGSSTYSSWGSLTGTGINSGGTYYYAGGGGGGTGGGTNAGGIGGGGAGIWAANSAATSGTANTGGGGGGNGAPQGTSAASGSGGSGIVIIRYPV